MYFQKKAAGELSYPMEDIPLESTGLVNPCFGDNEFKVPAPAQFGSDCHSDQVYEVVRVRQDVLRGDWPLWFFENHNIDSKIPEPLSKYGMIYNAKSAASAVHMDAPTDLFMALLKWINKDLGLTCAEYQFESTSGHVDFLGNPVTCLSRAGVNVRQALIEAFRVKYYFGMARPEEVTGIGASFTHYPEGCPAHPSYVAGHGAAAGATYATLAALFDLDEEQDLIVKTATQHFATYRTLAGVHFQPDNIEGWRLGVAVTRGLDSVCTVDW